MPDEGFAALLLVASRLLWYIGCLAVIGASAFAILAARTGSVGTIALRRRAARIGWMAAVVLLCGTAARLYAQAYSVFGVEEPITLELLWVTATDLPPWSLGWMLQAGTSLLGAGALWLVRSGRTSAWSGAHLGAVGVAASAPLTGHAVAQADWYALPVALQAGHVLAAGVWIGGLFVLFAVTLARDRKPRDHSTAPVEPTHGTGDVAPLVDAFSSMALAGAGLLALSGLATTVLYVPALDDLLHTTYGRALLVKLALFGGVAVLGLANWRYVRPRLAREDSLFLLRRTAAIELAIAAFVLAATAVLTGLPQPGEG